ncbi:DUF1292 domain-containing protein [Paenibacillus larvae]|nr:DUF1292 domain-containing protein [Paenibacillus larvae]AQR77552.1 DUF1292 domain-containing protein [Paenibacillus larvae subsp. larvae]AQT84015.1 DUF1292 domain-containing protein [Paenibacillus larvae subsp. pulvifaciens]AQZ45475.1 DUF1292 domain-containing protein [Paenibacillus larvae subsp. pulvifaciens]ARF67381.1 DUF1292 domain-containing protein [Paenibacillus larvae subsp. pulvifaciens]AVF21388.1 hypothetical protein ERICI_01500 [Paenibacillus larvae subsp. larvae]
MKVTPSSVLRNTFGHDIMLFDGQGQSTEYRLITEFNVNEQPYAVLQSEELRKEKDFAVFRVTLDEQGEPMLEHIEDDDEWETVSEIFDEMSFPEHDEW